MKYLYYTLIVTAITVTSCRNIETTATQANPGDVVPFYQQSGTAVQDQSIQSSETQNNNSGIVTATPPGMNPPHGQPNHRCDIPDGAPLSTAVNASASGQPSISQPLQVGTGLQNTTAKTVTAKGMNPPHGDSGHRCDIAVGAPLNSKATTTTTTSSNSAPASSEYTVQPAVPSLLSTGSADAETPAGMNPAHGKPGHRCEIGVGEPLSKE